MWRGETAFHITKKSWNREALPFLLFFLSAFLIPSPLSLSIYIYIYIYIYTYISIYIFLYISIFIHIHNKYVYMNVCMYTRTHIIHTYIYIYIYIYQKNYLRRQLKRERQTKWCWVPAHWLSGRVFANSTGDWSSGWVISKTQKVVLDTSLLNTQHYKVRFKVKVKQSKERSSALSYTSV